jgi:hypothetical protein
MPLVDIAAVCGFFIHAHFAVSVRFKGRYWIGESQMSTSEVADHVVHVQPATSFRKKAVNPGLAGDVTHSHAYVEENDTCDQAC